jgi:hypothetical protein
MSLESVLEEHSFVSIQSLVSELTLVGFQLTYWIPEIAVNNSLYVSCGDEWASMDVNGNSG